MANVGGTWFPHPPARGRIWEGVALTQRSGETGFPQTLTRWEGFAPSQRAAYRPLKLEKMRGTAGPRITTNRAGKIRNTIGKSILMGAC
jgi:hypothetical protein